MAKAPALQVEKSAVISDDGLYRYQLWRVWNFDLPILYFILLNPSTADAELDDPTLRRGMGFARDNGYGGICFVNLYAFRATKPNIMFKAADPVGPDNDAHIRGICLDAKATGGLVIAGWGIHGKDRRVCEVEWIAKNCDVQLFCLGYTDAGQPRHPLFMPADSKFQLFMSKFLHEAA